MSDQSRTLIAVDPDRLAAPPPFEGLDPPYEVILADPPWRFQSNSVAKPGRNALRHYPCMKLPSICGLPVREIAARDALLFLWVTAPFARLAFDVIDAWGFAYVSQMVWVKESIGTGYWIRNRHEIVYLAKRGRPPCGRPAPFEDSVIEGGKGRHSQKPAALAERIEAAFPHLHRVELFAREKREGWDSWGNEV